MRGNCNKCGERIALVGHPEVNGPQMASKVADRLEGPRPEPATDKQLDYLRQLGAAPEQLQGLDREQASDLIEKQKQRRSTAEPATERQMAYLRRLGATEAQIAAAVSKAAASSLIEEMHLQPTREQLEYLHTLGATGAQVAALKTRGQASASLTP